MGWVPLNSGFNGFGRPGSAASMARRCGNSNIGVPSTSLALLSGTLAGTAFRLMDVGWVALGGPGPADAWRRREGHGRMFATPSWVNLSYVRLSGQPRVTRATTVKALP
jgi:hypothetical protein